MFQPLCTELNTARYYALENGWKWVSVDGNTEVEMDFKNWKKLATAGYDLCMTGDVSNKKLFDDFFLHTCKNLGQRSICHKQGYDLMVFFT